MFSVAFYEWVRHTCNVEGLSVREAARRFGVKHVLGHPVAIQVISHPLGL